MSRKLIKWILLSLIVIISQVTCQQSSSQVDKIEMNPLEPKPGESVKIRCYLKNVDPTKKIKPDILWSFQERGSNNWRIIGNGGAITDTFNNRLSGRKESDEVFEIVFRPIQETDAGIIKCEITNTEGQIFKIQRMDIYSPPYINFITPDIYAKIGQKIVLECNVEGFPKPIVQWTRLGELSAVYYGSKFEITSVDKQDRGTYKCFAENITPVNKLKQSAEAYVTVTIDFVPTITCGNDIVYQVSDINADAEISCTVDGHPLNNVRWYFSQDDFNVETELKTDQFHKIENIASPDSIKSLLVIRNVKQDSFGTYTIKVEGGQQQIVDKTIRLERLENVDGEFTNKSSNTLSKAQFFSLFSFLFFVYFLVFVLV